MAEDVEDAATVRDRIDLVAWSYLRASNARLGGVGTAEMHIQWFA
jgi:hypothetical protein